MRFGILIVFIAMMVVLVLYLGKGGQTNPVAQNMTALEKAKIATLELDMNSISAAVTAYFGDNSEYPENLDMLVPKYLPSTTSILDSWGNPLHLEKDNLQNLFLISAGTGPGFCDQRRHQKETMMKLAKYLKVENIYITDTCKDTGSFYGEFALFLKQRGLIDDVKKVKRLFVKRESIQSTGIGKGVATPHVFSSEFSDFILAAALIHCGLDFKAPDGRDVQLVFLIMSDDRDIGLHLKTLAHIARLTAGTDIIDGLKNAHSAADIFDILTEKEKAIPH